VSRYQKSNTNLDFTEARDSEWQWQQLGRMQVCTSLQADNHASTLPLSFLQAGCPSCRPANSVKALQALGTRIITYNTVQDRWKETSMQKPARFFKSFQYNTGFVTDRQTMTAITV